MLFNEQYLDDLMARLAYHSSAIQRNKISLAETNEILFNDGLITDRKSSRDYYEILNYQSMFKLLIERIKIDEKLVVNDINQIHLLLTQNMPIPSGQFKDEPNRIKGSAIITASPKETPILISQWLDQSYEDILQAKGQRDLLYALANSHYHFERIHPFPCHNGPVGRVILMYLGMKYLQTPIIIQQEDCEEYLDVMERADMERLVLLLRKAVEQEKKQIALFKQEKV